MTNADDGAVTEGRVAVIRIVRCKRKASEAINVGNKENKIWLLHFG